jgi:hypothetical protein
MQPPDRGIGLGSDDENDSPEPPESIRDLQRRRRDAARMRADIEAILASPDEEEGEAEPQPGPPGPASAKVWVVFRAIQWNDPSGSLRESDSIVGVYASEEAARRTAAQLNKETAAGAGEGDAWYQPYTVES